MATYRLQEGFEVQNSQMFFTLVLQDDAGREIHSERISVPLNANSSVVATVIQTAAARFPSMKVEDLIRDAVAGLTP